MTGDGVSVEIASLGEANLVFVDEGHKGTGSEAQTWKDRQSGSPPVGSCSSTALRLQAIAAASRKKAGRSGTSTARPSCSTTPTATSTATGSARTSG